MNILLVDDDSVDRESIRRSLRNNKTDFHIVEAETVDESLELMQTAKFDVVLLDYNLPQRNGIELLLEMKGSDLHGNATFIMMSTDENDARALECITAGAQDFLTKLEITPFRLQRAIMNARTRSELERKLLDSYIKTKVLAERDSLTGLSNRYFFDETLKVAIANNQRGKNIVALLLIDLDHFKYVNDSYGHDVGDQLLIDVVNRISDQLRDNELFSRLGGDEFALVLTNLASLQVASDIAERIIKAFKEPFLVHGKVIQSGLSIGISLSPFDSNDAKELFKFADIAMYRAKNSGRNQFSFFEREMQEQAIETYQMEANLREAIVQKSFSLHYQPLICSKTKKVVGAEALIRWRYKGEFISPDRFIPIAERSMLIIDIGWWVLEEGLEQLGKWNHQKESPISISINLSTVQLMDSNFVDKFAQRLAYYQIRPSYLTLEITETALLTKADEAAEILSKLSDMGCKIAIDDFGTGFSSLSHLINFPLDIVKIDKSLMPFISKGQKEKHILSGIVSMVKSLELELVAEGIEQQMDVDLCCQLHVDRLQGFYFDKALPEKEFTAKYIK